MGVFTKEDLMRFQAESLDDKFQRTLAKVAEWYSRWDNEVYVSFSGGKDSTVLADICARWCKVIGKPLYLVFVNTGLEYPEIQKNVKLFADYLRNKYGIEVVLEILRPKMRFDEVIKTYGYPIISKAVSNCVRGARNGSKSRLNLLNGKDCDGSDRKSKFSKLKYKPLLDVDFKISEQCCDVMKKAPSYEYQKRTGRKPILATMAVESMLRESAWLKNGCNAFDSKKPQSAPMSFWTEQDVLQYIKQEKIPIASVYGDIIYEVYPEQMRIEDYGIECGTDKLTTTGCDRTGCIFCAFGCHLEKSPSRFERLKETHPRQYEYCIGGGEYDESGVWKPNKKGLGMGHVFDELNKIYGDDFIKY
jgi:3'-phosphoadenosine 5'-phosphosulfate sulfotransferase (PAPS reductase)/FAD synthetase